MFHILSGCNNLWLKYSFLRIYNGIKKNFILLHSSIVLFSCTECSFPVSIMDEAVNILLTSPSCLLICLAISSKPLDKIFSLSETANKVEFKDLSVDFKTVTCCFKNLKKLHLLFFETVNFIGVVICAFVI